MCLVIRRYGWRHPASPRPSPPGRTPAGTAAGPAGPGRASGPARHAPLRVGAPVPPQQHLRRRGGLQAHLPPVPWVGHPTQQADRLQPVTEPTRRGGYDVEQLGQTVDIGLRPAAEQRQHPQLGGRHGEPVPGAGGIEHTHQRLGSRVDRRGEIRSFHPMSPAIVPLVLPDRHGAVRQPSPRPTDPRQSRHTTTASSRRSASAWKACNSRITVPIASVGGCNRVARIERAIARSP